MSYRKMIWFFQAAVLAAALLAGGCGNGEDEDPSYSQPELVDDLPSEETGEGEEDAAAEGRGPGGAIQRLEDIKIGGGAPLVKTTKTDPLTCEFKTDHIMDGLSASGRSLLLEYKAHYALVPSVFQKNNKGGLFGLRKALTYKPKDRFFQRNALLIRPYIYNRKGKYKSWCPEKGDCLVHIVFQGAIHEPRNRQRGSDKGGYLFSGPLLISVVFNGELLNFSSCPEKPPEDSPKKAKK